jgi:hypothetical protein
MGEFTNESLLTVPTFSTSSTFLTVDYLIDLLEVFPNLRGGRAALPGSATATSSASAHTLRPVVPLRKSLDVCVEVDGHIAAKQLCIHSQVILIISAKTHHPQLIVVRRRVVAIGHRQPPSLHSLRKKPVKQRKKQVSNKKGKKRGRRAEEDTGITFGRSIGVVVNDLTGD